MKGENLVTLTVKIIGGSDSKTTIVTVDPTVAPGSRLSDRGTDPRMDFPRHTASSS